MEYKPLAERVRPSTIKDIFGQQHLLDEQKIVHELIRNKKPVSLILWGPPGSGKTTLARIMASQMDADFIELSAVTSGIADVKEVIKRAGQNQRLGMQTILFVDEIHRFNKAQQDAFLPHVERGSITLIGATTENPSFEIITPLLSRSRILILKPLADADMLALLKRAAKLEKATKRIKPRAYDLLIELAGGDARVALGNLELALHLTNKTVTPEVVTMAAQRKAPNYDKKGEQHYNVISAFIKSMRASQPNAALYWLARMLAAGEDPKFIARRMVVFASEDIGVAASPALNLAVSTFEAVERVGMPECRFNLYHCALVLASAKKSRLINDAMLKAEQAASQYPDLPVPLPIQSKASRATRRRGSDPESQDRHNSFNYLPDKLADFDALH